MYGVEVTGRMRRAKGGLSVLMAALLAGCSAPPAESPPAASPSEAPSSPLTRIEQDIVYRSVDGGELALDAYVPGRPLADPAPAVVVVHGGGFLGGDKGAPDAAPIAATLARQGYAAFSVDYRLLPSGAFPTALEDVQSAIAWLRDPAQAERFGIDPDRIGAFGGSAGAILVSEAGTAGEGPLDEGVRLKAVVELSGVMDFTSGAVVPGLASSDVERGLAYLGCSDPDECPAAEEASPLAHVDPSDPPFFLAHSIDEDLPEQSTVALADALEADGVPVELELRPGSAHSVGMLDDALLDRILAFLATHL